MIKFTKQQLDNFKAYERVRRSGRYNMLTPAANRATGLSDDDFFFVIDNYEELEQANKEVGATAKA